MSNDSRNPKSGDAQLGEFLAETMRSGEALPESPEASVQTIAAMQAALRSRKKQPPRRFVSVRAGLGAALALAAVLVLVVYLPRSGTVPTDPASFRAQPATVAASFETPANAVGPVPSGWEWPSDAWVKTEPEGQASFEFGDGTRVALAAETRTRFRRQARTRRFEVELGRAEFSVTPLEATARFEVLTDEVVAFVRGTRFSVERLREPPCPGHPATRVQVQEGQVDVVHLGKTVSVRAGAAWPEACAPAGAASEPAPVPQPSGAPLPRNGGLAIPPPTPSSTLDAQNELFGLAVKAERAGDTEAAIAGYERLLSAHPNGVLSASAAVARLKLLGKEPTSVRARMAAREYLEKYPGGFGADQARKILDREPETQR